MSRNKGHDTKPEVMLRKACWRAGLRFRLNTRLPGRPDFVLPRYKVAVFVDGCFWHGCPVHYKAPVARADFWLGKLTANRNRDAIVNQLLADLGWTVVRVWEHEVRKDLPSALDRVLQQVG
jgi:DNA mismatch endonuclease (patch repair protein)